ncbi:hypothetical protein B0T18DRAFT_431087 [Schizothecium vesticola]|uniref:Uncharacterized protein n=1 Tax=Schizothecium vesticola TaxID=314040 RepID=A0AA40EQZ9_9PEZI|nr:hypothetical protein B0T18DRAFT_431087 [Schizothecium vesticola]
MDKVKSEADSFDKADAFEKATRADSFASAITAVDPDADPEAADPVAEAKKKKTRRRCRPRFNLAITVHILSISITCTLLAVYIRDLTWNPSPNEINALLIAAKAHELLIQASLATILLHRIRVCLRGSHGVPLGFLSAPFALNSVYYLFSKQFWKAATRSKSKERGDITTRVLVVGIIFLALAAGPSAGILMLPKLGWWKVTDLEGIGKMSEEMGNLILIRPGVPGSNVSSVEGNDTAVSMEEFYPQELAFDQVDGPCSSPSRTADSACPGTAASQILGKLPLITAPKLPNKYNFNLTINGAQHQRDITVGWAGNGGKSAVVYATSPMDMIARELQLLGDRVWPDPLRGIKIVLDSMQFSVRQAQVATVNDQPVYRNAVYGSERLWQQPALAVQCLPCRGSETHYLVDEPLHAPFSSLAPAPGSPFSLPKGDFLSQFPGEPSPLLVLSTPHPSLSTALLWASPDSRTPSTLCLVLAKWTKASVSISKPNDRTAATDWSTDPSRVFLSKPSDSDTTSSPITLSPSFSLAALNAIPSTNNTINKNNTTTPLPTLCPPSTPGRCLPIALSLLLTDALSRHLNTASLSTCTTPPPPTPSPSSPPSPAPPATTRPSPSKPTPPSSPTSPSPPPTSRGNTPTGSTAEHGVRKRTYGVGMTRDGGGWDEVGELVAVALRRNRSENGTNVST